MMQKAVVEGCGYDLPSFTAGYRASYGANENARLIGLRCEISLAGDF